MIKPSTHPGRVFVALIASAFLGCFVGLFALPYFAGETVRPPGFGAFVEVLLLAWMLTLPVSLVFGALTHWGLIKLKLWPVTAYTIAGMALGPLALIVWDMMLSRSLEFNWLAQDLTWLGVIVGGATALSFRLMVHKSSDSPSFPPAGTRPY